MRIPFSQTICPQNFPLDSLIFFREKKHISEFYFIFENFGISRNDIISVELAHIFIIYHIGMLSKRECKSRRKIKQLDKNMYPMLVEMSVSQGKN